MQEQTHKQTLTLKKLQDVAQFVLQACGGGQDGAIRLWRSIPARSQASEFDLSLPTKVTGHTGPVVSLASDRRYTSSMVHLLPSKEQPSSSCLQRQTIFYTLQSQLRRIED